ncbi:non-ribosomal peptide synthetase [Streptomyces flaveolus]|uniref:non-ribosomal peptide synthetase n=1 Tax=Streptomyces flaveolus TaxID=67297 RepID=UPI00069E441E|nr:non-ribosomal peptide synthetase [Streptomyces antibioticus]KOG59479.1 hypothetical protein ADK77_39855 [Streptomyces antibioticus]
MKTSGLEDVLPLSPLQEGLLFHALEGAADTDATGTGDNDVYTAQMVLDLTGPLDAARLRTAAGALLRRHANLRAGFRQRANGQAIQVVHREVPLPWEESDLTGLPEAEREAALGRILDEERARPFDLAVPPALRFRLVRRAADRHALVLTNHHILWDGWSAPVLQRELLTLYAGHGDPSGLEPVTPYRTYLAWLAAQDRAASERAWRQALAGLDRPTLVAPGTGRASVRPRWHTVELTEERTAALLGAARAGGLTLNTVLQGAWALTLRELTGQDDVVFGSVVSGRPPQLPGVETMVGLFINTVPVRVRLDAALPLARSLVRLQEEQALLLDHQQLRLGDVQRIAGHGELFDTVLTVENYPGGGGPQPVHDGVRVARVTGQDAAHYPMRLIAGLAGRRLVVRLEYRPDLYDEDTSRMVLGHVVRLLRTAADRPGTTVGGLPHLLPQEGAPLPGRAEAPKGGEESAPVAVTRSGGPREEILCGLFAEVLGHPSFGPGESFFGRGGHSLSALKLLGRVRAVFGVSLPVRELFAAPTPALFGERIRQAAGEPDRPEPAARPRPARIPLSFAQQRLWFLYRAEGPSPTYNVPIPLRLTGELDLAALTAALGDLTRRHESLRTVFPAEQGVPYQRVLQEAVPPVEVVDTDPEGAAELLAKAARYPFDLAAEIPLRATVLRLGPREHVLLLLVHHIAADGGSVAPLLADLAEAYTARGRGTAPGWLPLPLQYADYALWQREVLGDEDDPDSLLARQLAFWRSALAGAPGTLDLPADRPRPAVADHRGGTVTFRSGAATHRRLTELARATGSTVFMVVQAALAALLSRMGAGDDIPLGTAVGGRGAPALEGLTGFFVNTLVLRTDTSGDPAFSELVSRVRKTDLAAYDHQDLPFERLVEAVNPVRSAAAHPLFQVMLAFQNNAEPSMRMPGLAVGFEGLATNAARCDLSFSVAETRGEDGAPGGLRGILEYARALFDPETAQDLADRFVRLLDAAAQDPERRLSALDLLSAGERAQLAAEAERAAPAAAPDTLPALFARQAARTPDAPAVQHGATTLTYAELDARANRLAHRLAELGAAPETFVALALPASADLVVAVLAATKAGAAWVPLDPEYPRQRLELMLAETAPCAVLATEESARRLPATSTPVLIGTDAPGRPAEAPPTVLRPGHPAYVIYTSGSTGTPKGVVVTHAGLAGLGESSRRDHGAGPGSRVLQFVSPSFDVSVAELCMALLTGACLVIPEQRPVGDGLAAFLAEQRISHAHLPPAVLAGLPPADLPDLATLMTGGEACTPQLVGRWAPGRRMVNAYGPTEATCEVTYAVQDPTAGGSARSIGRAMDGVRVHVLDASLRPTPPGAPGELYIAGPGLARGYLDRPAQTAGRFVADPYGSPGTRMYRTGDLVRRMRDGRLDFVGRADGQVKLRGFRIETGEIESALLDVPGVRHAAVVVREDRPGDPRLVAYAVAAAPDLDTAGALAALRGRLPEYMVPGVLVTLDELPLTPNGKLDVRALPAPAEPSGPGRAPRTAREELMCRLFAEVLGVAEVGMDDSFFARGGHSLLASRLAGLVGQALGTEPGVREIFAAPTPALLLRLVDGDGDGDSPGAGFTPLLPLRTAGTKTPLFCVHPVGGLAWCYSGLLRTLDPERPVYGLQSAGLDGTAPLAATLDGMLDGYVEQLRAVQPHGPYRLLGWSLGGTLAHLLAAELQRRGEQVEQLVLLDAYPVEEHRRAYLSAEQVLGDLCRAHARLHGDDPDAVPEGAAALSERIVDYLGRGDSELSRLDPEQRHAVLGALVNNVRLVSPAEPPVFKGDILLVAATEDVRDWADQEAWTPYVSGVVDRLEVAATHEGLLAPGPAAETGRLLGCRD